jgi:predicted Zn-ribbon and HTH transcriptional regulator
MSWLDFKHYGSDHYRGRPRKGEGLRKPVSFSLSEETRTKLFKLPKGERSEFVNQGILLATSITTCPTCGVVFKQQVTREFGCPLCKLRKLTPPPLIVGY